MASISWERAYIALGSPLAEKPADWPARLAIGHAAWLQCDPANGAPASTSNDAVRWVSYRAMLTCLESAIKEGSLPHAVVEFRHLERHTGRRVLSSGLDMPPHVAAQRQNERRRLHETTCQLPAITAADFVAWLGMQGEMPSAHIAAWLEATAPGIGASAPPKSSQAQMKAAREDSRLSFCEAEGIAFDAQSLLRLPDGIGAAAQKLGITRQSLATDLKAALRRQVEAGRSGKV